MGVKSGQKRGGKVQEKKDAIKSDAHGPSVV
jgi:hypothetical protein